MVEKEESYNYNVIVSYYIVHAEWRKKFDNFDMNKDGVISGDEITRLMQYVGFNPTKDDEEDFLQRLGKTNNSNCIFFSLYQNVKTHLQNYQIHLTLVLITYLY